MKIENIAKDEIRLFERVSAKTSKQMIIEITHLRWLLAKSWGAVEESGYEDHDFKLRDKIEEAL